MSNVSNSSTTTLSLEQQSLKELDAQVVVNIFLLLTSLSTTLSNMAVLFGLYKGGNTFKTHHYKLVTQMTTVACFQALFIFIVMGVIRFGNTIFRIPANLTVKDCGLLLLVMEATVVIDPYNVLILSIDRLIAVAYPFQYKHMNLTKKYKICTLAAPWIAGSFDTLAKFLLWTGDFISKNVSVCIITNTRTPNYANYKYYRGLIVGGLTIYFYLLGIVFVKYKIYKNHNTNVGQLKKELGFRLMVTCGVDAVIYTCTFYFSQIYQTVILANATPQARNTLAPVGLMFILLATTPRFVVNYYLNKEFQRIIKKHLFRINRNSVVAITTTKGRSTTNIQ